MEFITSIIPLLTANWAEIGVAYLSLTGTFAIIARYTKNKTDDRIVQFLYDLVNFFGWNRGNAANDLEVGGNVKQAVSLKKLQALALILLVPLLGCASVHDNGVRAGGMAEAYRVTGPSVIVGVEGDVECTSPDPAAFPCSAEYAAGWEMWHPIVETLAVPFEALLQLFGRTLIPVGG